jgi:multiple sugar transport system permease protein
MGSSATASARIVSTSRRAVSAHRLGGTIGFYLIVLVLTLFFFGPFVWTVLSSLKSARELYLYPPSLLPAILRFGNYPEAWSKVPFLSFYTNSVIVTGLAVTGQTLTSTLVAYGFARFRFPFRNALFMLVLSTLMMPWEVTIVPSFLLFKWLGWLDTLTPLIVPSWFGGGPFFIFLMRQFFLTIPRDYDEAATIDGAGSFQILREILVPLCRPAITTVAIFSFLNHWNSFLEPLIYLNTPERFTVSLGLRFFQTAPNDSGEPREHLLMAAAVIVVAPCVVLFFAAQRYFVKGIVMSGLKG